MKIEDVDSYSQLIGDRLQDTTLRELEKVASTFSKN